MSKTLLTIVLLQVSAAGQTSQLKETTAGWSRTAKIELINPGEPLRDYPVRIVVAPESLAESSRPEARDIRFVDPRSRREIPYWREGRTGDNWVFWVKPDAMEGHSRHKLLLLSGKPNLKDASRPRDVFILFDDFSDEHIDNSKWQVSAEKSKLHVSDGTLRLQTLEKTSQAVADAFRPLENLPGLAVEARIRGNSIFRGGVMVTGPQRTSLFSTGLGSELGIHHGMFYFNGAQATPQPRRWYRLCYSIRGRRAQGTVLTDEGEKILSRKAILRADLPRILRLSAWQDTPEDPALSDYEVDWVLVRPLSHPQPHAEVDGRPAERPPEDAEDQGLLNLEYEPVIAEALDISRLDVLSTRTVRADGMGFVPGGHYNDIWLTDCTFLLEAYRFWGVGYDQFLYSEAEGQGGLVPRFAAAQDPQDGTIPMAFWGRPGKPNYGGRYDYAQGLKGNRDMESPYTFVHINYDYWLDSGDPTFIRRFKTAMCRGLEPIDRRRDPHTGLILGTYGPPNADNCVDYAVPETTAHPYFNALYVRAYLEYARIAEALGDTSHPAVYRAKAQALRDAVNQHMWIPARNRYEARILRTPVSTDPQLPASRVKEDTRFPVVDNMLLLYYGIPDTPRKIEALVASIDESEKGLAVVGQMVEPPYPDDFLTRAYKNYNGGNYHNGDVWTWFSNRYATVLYRLGYPEKGNHVLRSQARVAVRDQGFCEFYEDDETGRAKGAFPYSPTAASFQLAVVQGLFGIHVDMPRRTLQVHPSLWRSGKLRLRLAGKTAEVALDLDPERKEIRLRLNSQFHGRGDFSILIPKSFETAGQWSVAGGTAGKLSPLASSVVSRGNASYVEFEADLTSGSHAFRLSNPSRHPAP